MFQIVPYFLSFTAHVCLYLPLNIYVQNYVRYLGSTFVNSERYNMLYSKNLKMHKLPLLDHKLSLQTMHHLKKNLPLIVLFLFFFYFFFIVVLGIEPRTLYTQASTVSFSYIPLFSFIFLVVSNCILNFLFSFLFDLTVPKPQGMQQSLESLQQALSLPCICNTQCLRHLIQKDFPCSSSGRNLESTSV